MCVHCTLVTHALLHTHCTVAARGQDWQQVLYVHVHVVCTYVCTCVCTYVCISVTFLEIILT